jgi:hypothetical protein
VGKLIYGSSTMEVEFDDRALLHLQIIVATKLRLGESFMFSWKDDPAIGDGRSTLWIDRSIPLYFKFYGCKVPTVNSQWLEELLTSANSGTGLILTPEPSMALSAQ